MNREEFEEKHLKKQIKFYVAETEKIFEELKANGEIEESAEDLEELINFIFYRFEFMENKIEKLEKRLNELTKDTRD